MKCRTQSFGGSKSGSKGARNAALALFRRFLKVNCYQMAPQRAPSTQLSPNNSFSGAWRD